MVPEERRIQQRFFLEIQAKLSLEDRSVVEETTAANISSGGAFIRTSLKPHLASKVFIEFLVELDDLKNLRFILSTESLKTLSGKKIWVSASGIVIRLEDDGIGIIFDQDYQLTPLEATNP